MAVIRKVNGKDETVKAEQGSQYWLVLNNKVDGTPEEEAYCSEIKHIFLNWRKAPDQYIRDNFTKYREKARDDWYVDHQGKPTRPQFNSDWTLAKKWNLFSAHQPDNSTIEHIY